MTKYALYVHLEAKPGKEQEVAGFLSSALPLVNQEPETTAWFALRMSLISVRTRSLSFHKCMSYQ
jgi:hypothetical protein